MRYYATASGPLVRDAMRRGLIGMIATPASGNAVEPGYDWCADNGVFGDNYPGDDAYLRWLGDRAEYSAACSFAVAPDVVGDAVATLERSAPMLGRIRDAGYPVALAAQDGMRPSDIPWTRVDALFIGGSTEWKLGPDARQLVEAARRHGKWIHMGRVSSDRRLRYAHAIGCHSADGTYLAFGPDVNLPRLLGWLSRMNDQYGLFEVSA